MSSISISTLVSARTGEPKVDLVDPEKEWRVQLTVEEARALAWNILQAAEAALVDSFLHNFLVRELDLDNGRSARVLNEFRKFRGHHNAWPKVVVTE